MKALKITTLAILTAVAMTSCQGLQDTPTADNSTPQVNADDGGTQALDRNSIVPCGVWEPIRFADAAGFEYAEGEMINDEDNVYFWIEVSDEYQIEELNAFAGSIHEIPNTDGAMNVYDFPVQLEFENEEEPGPRGPRRIIDEEVTRTQELLLSFPRAALENCTSFVINMQISIISEDPNAESIMHSLFMTGTPVHNATALEYCAQEC